jgi:nucleoside-diphosphate-sugar epimerase
LRILVTGAAGFIGSHLSERLARLGHNVLGLDCLTDYYARALKSLNVKAIEEQGVTFLPLDLAVDELGPAVRDVDVVFHAAAQPGLSATSTFETYVRNNITATHRLLEACRQAPSVPALYYVSTSSVYGAIATGSEDTEPRPTSPYGVTKLAAEQLALSYHRTQGLPVCSLRLFSVYGPRERPEKLYSLLIRSILEGEEFPLYEGSESHVRSYTYIDDIIDGMVAAAERPEDCAGQIFNVGTDRTITTGAGIEIVEQIIGRKARIKQVPARRGDQLKTQANIEKACRVLGYEPDTTPEEGLRHQVNWYEDSVLGKVDF